MSNPENPLSGELFIALQRLTEVLNDRGADYALIGGLGSAIRGAIRTTRDVDILLAIPQLKLPPLLEGFRDVGFHLDVAECIRQWNQDNLTDFNLGAVRIDLLKASLPVFQAVLKRAKWEVVDGHAIRAADAEGLILLKLISFRPRDQEDIQGILASSPGTLDLDWIRFEWQKLEGSDPARKEVFERMVDVFYTD
ncbi:MAG: nucleotidyltransferase [Planctomycetota bacterium]|nr:nucleotidyltransferase [Planctomycetota bacterium]MDA1140713.1 nucleotidyltransferase [Planctomycetota bacterium]